MPEKNALRLVDLGLVQADVWHKAYQHLAESLPAEGNPILLCGRTPAHFCLGAHQGQSLELAPTCNIPVLQRPLGGGGVWLDEQQLLLVLILPHNWISGKRPTQWFDALLQPMRKTYAHFGIAAERVVHDLWFQGKKLAGSGAASMGRAGLVASSFLFRFPAEHFAACIAAPSAGFRQWLGEALGEAVTDWHSIAPVPAQCELMQQLQRELKTHLGCAITHSVLTAAEQTAIAAYQPDENEIYPARQRLVPHGIKLNARRFLTERHYVTAHGDDWVRAQTRGDKLERLALSLSLGETVLTELLQCTPDTTSLTAVLQSHTDEAGLWAERIVQTAHFEND